LALSRSFTQEISSEDMCRTGAILEETNLANSGSFEALHN
jgi:hypothetical protein